MLPLFPIRLVGAGAIRANEIADAALKRLPELSLSTQNDTSVMWELLLQSIRIAVTDQVNHLA